MKVLKHLFPFIFLIAPLLSFGQADQIDSVKFFEDQSMIEMTLDMNMKDLLQKKQKEKFLPATITMKFQDGTTITEGIKLSVRGNFRRENCYMPGLRLDFHNPTSPRLYKLDKLKMVAGCNTSNESEQLVLREYLVYKMFELFTDKSLRTRLLKVTYTDAGGKKKPYTQYAFFIEDIDEMARRHNMKEVEGTMFNTEITNREQMTLVAMFQYMIGNTDWSVPNYHNIKLIGAKDNSSRPYAIPYDFDICGFVDPPYATVDEQLNIENVRQRLYRGFPRTMEELQVMAKEFLSRKDKIYSMIRDFALLDNRSKDWTTKFLDEFFRTISSDRDLKMIFIDNARGN